MVNPAEAPKPEITEEKVENILIELNNSGVLMHLRALINGDNSFFDTNKEYIQENDESTTGDILDTYLAAIEQSLPLAVKDLREPELKEAFKKALAKDSVERRILLAYWGLDEESPWYMAESNITNYQTFENKDFPSYLDIERVLEKLQ